MSSTNTSIQKKNNNSKTTKNKAKNTKAIDKEIEEDQSTSNSSIKSPSSFTSTSNVTNNSTSSTSNPFPSTNKTSTPEDDDNQSEIYSTRDADSVNEEDQDEEVVIEEEDNYMEDKEQSGTISKLLQSRPVMFSGNQKDFLLYKRHLIILLSGCNLVEELKPKQERIKKYTSNRISRTRTVTMINSTLPQKIADSFLELFEVDDSYNLDIDPVMYWKAICNRYEKNTEINKQRVQQELAEEKLNGSEPIDDYVGRLTVHFQRLKSFGEEMKEDSKKYHLQKGLSSEYKSYTQAMSLVSATMSYEEVITHLTNFQETLRAEHKKETTEEAHLANTSLRNKHDERAAFIRDISTIHSSRGRFSNYRGLGRGGYRGRGRFNQQRREYNRPFRSHNKFGGYVPKQIFNYNQRGGYRGRGSFRGRGRGNFFRHPINRGDSNSNNNNNEASTHSNNNNNNASSDQNGQQQNHKRELVCWKCNKPGHKSIDCRN